MLLHREQLAEAYQQLGFTRTDSNGFTVFRRNEDHTAMHYAFHDNEVESSFVLEDAETVDPVLAEKLKEAIFRVLSE